MCLSKYYDILKLQTTTHDFLTLRKKEHVCMLWFVVITSSYNFYESRDLINISNTNHDNVIIRNTGTGFL